MKIQIAACLLGLALLPACSTTSMTTAQHQTLEQRLMTKYASVGTAMEEPAPPAEGPEDVPADAPSNVDHNPTLVPSPLLRYWASSRTPWPAFFARPAKYARRAATSEEVARRGGPLQPI